MTAADFGEILLAAATLMLPADQRDGTRLEVEVSHAQTIDLQTGNFDMSSALGRLAFVSACKDAVCRDLEGSRCDVALASYGSGRRRRQLQSDGGTAVLNVDRTYQHGSSPNASAPVGELLKQGLVSHGVNVTGFTTTALSAKTTVVSQGDRESSAVDDAFSSTTAIADALSAVLPPSSSGGSMFSVQDLVVSEPPAPPPPPPPSPPSPPFHQTAAKVDDLNRTITILALVLSSVAIVFCFVGCAFVLMRRCRFGKAKSRVAAPPLSPQPPSASKAASEPADVPPVTKASPKLDAPPLAPPLAAARTAARAPPPEAHAAGMAAVLGSKWHHRQQRGIAKPSPERQAPMLLEARAPPLAAVLRIQRHRREQRAAITSTEGAAAPLAMRKAPTLSEARAAPMAAVLASQWLHRSRSEPRIVPGPSTSAAEDATATTQPRDSISEPISEPISPSASGRPLQDLLGEELGEPRSLASRTASSAGLDSDTQAAARRVKQTISGSLRLSRQQQRAYVPSGADESPSQRGWSPPAPARRAPTLKAKAGMVLVRQLTQVIGDLSPSLQEVSHGADPSSSGASAGGSGDAAASRNAVLGADVKPAAVEPAGNRKAPPVNQSSVSQAPKASSFGCRRPLQRWSNVFAEA